MGTGGEELIEKAKVYRHTFDRDFLNEVIADNNKQRFAFSEDGNIIRANQGHSFDVDLKLEADAECMHQDGIEFRKSANGVWLVPAVDPKYLTFAGHVA